MILGQLIQTGRRFCECRSADFIPQTEEQLVMISYSIHDRMQAHSFHAESADLVRQLQDQLQDLEAIAYLLIQRFERPSQSEFPSPLGRKPMDRITLTAATPNRQLSESYFLESVPTANACRLIPTSRVNRNSQVHSANLLQYPQAQPVDSTYDLFATYAEHAS